MHAIRQCLLSLQDFLNPGEVAAIVDIERERKSRAAFLLFHARQQRRGGTWTEGRHGEALHHLYSWSWFF